MRQQSQNIEDRGYKGHTARGPFLPQAIRGEARRSEKAPRHDREGYTFLRQDGSEAFYSFTRIEEEMDRRGRALLALGLKKGDRVAFILTEGEDFVLTFFAAMAVGVVPVPMYPPLSFGKLDAYLETTARILTAAGAKAVLTDKRVQAILWSLIDRVEGLEAIHTMDKLNAAAPAKVEPYDLSHLQPDDMAFLQFTSGSTAMPRGVVVTHATLTANNFAIMKYGLEINDSDRAVSWLPLYHDMGLIGFVLAPIWWGVPAYLIPTLQFVKHPTLWMQKVHEFRGTITFAPNFAYALATRRTSEEKLAAMDLSCLRSLGCGAEPNHPQTLRAFMDKFARAKMKPTAILPSYGMAEATLAMSMSKLSEPLRTDIVDAEEYHDQHRANPAYGDRGAREFVTCGRAFPNHQLLICDEFGNELPERQVGEIVFRGPSVAAGYYRDEEASARTFSPWGLRTGDLGYRVSTPDGDEIFVTGRQKDVIILNGRNYDPQSIEWCATDVPGIRKGNVVAFSRSGAHSEELVIVAETKETDHEALKKRLRDHVAEELSLSAADVVLVGPGQLPKTSSGKLQRRKTREQYLAGVLGKEGVRTLGSRGDMLVIARHVARSMVSRVRFTLRRNTDRILQAALSQARELSGRGEDSPRL